MKRLVLALAFVLLAGCSSTGSIQKDTSQPKQLTMENVIGEVWVHDFDDHKIYLDIQNKYVILWIVGADGECNGRIPRAVTWDGNRIFPKPGITANPWVVYPQQSDIDIKFPKRVDRVTYRPARIEPRQYCFGGGSGA